jgi:hypothetical protein
MISWGAIAWQQEIPAYPASRSHVFVFARGENPEFDSVDLLAKTHV